MQVIQLMMFRELVNVRYSARKFADVPLFRTMQWGCFDTGMPTPIPIPSCSCSRSRSP